MVEHLLAKEKVAGSNPVFRSNKTVRNPEAYVGRFFVALCDIYVLDSEYDSGRDSVEMGASAGVAKRQTLRS